MDFSDVSAADLHALANALESRLRPPYSSIAIKRIVTGSQTDAIADLLRTLESSGFEPNQIKMLLDTILADRSSQPGVEQMIDLVTTGPEVEGIANRDTAVVVRNLFSKATETVLIAGYAVYQGKKVFQALAKRMNQIESLDVTMFLNLPNGSGVEQESLLVRKFVDRFRKTQWPKGCRFPNVYYDPRSVDSDPSKRASLHAKCIVVDSQEVFISSANFTDRAQHHNIEVGVQISSQSIANQLNQHFRSLARQQVLKMIIW